MYNSHSNELKYYFENLEEKIMWKKSINYQQFSSEMRLAERFEEEETKTGDKKNNSNLKDEGWEFGIQRVDFFPYSIVCNCIG